MNNIIQKIILNHKILLPIVVVAGISAAEIITLLHLTYKVNVMEDEIKKGNKAKSKMSYSRKKNSSNNEQTETNKIEITACDNCGLVKQKSYV